MDKTLFLAFGGKVKTVSIGSAEATLRTVDGHNMGAYQLAEQELQAACNQEPQDSREIARVSMAIVAMTLCDPDTLELLGEDYVKSLPFSAISKLSLQAIKLQQVSLLDIAEEKKDLETAPQDAGSSSLPTDGVVPFQSSANG